jgi:hypothetical protein
MVHGVDHRTWLMVHRNPFDFMCAVKAKGHDRLWYGNEQIQRTTRYYISRHGAELFKIAPPKGITGAPKKANGVPEHEYQRVMNEVGWVWDARVCTKNRSVHQECKTSVEAGQKVGICNNMSAFDWDNVNYEWYVNEAEKLII